MAKHGIMFMNALSPVHNGSGIGLGFVDRPIIREAHTLFPYIQSKSIKGVLRDAFGDDDDTAVQAIFGPPPRQGDSHGGAVNFSDARLLAFPVRSLKGLFVWATTPLLIHLFWRSIKLAGLEATFQKLQVLLSVVDSTFNNSDDSVMICPSGETSLKINNKIVLEEFPKNLKTEAKLEEFAKDISPSLFNSAADTYLKAEFERKLVVLPENSFRHFILYATEIIPNIAIDKNGTTEKGTLRYTEYLPSETILYSFVMFERAKDPGDKDNNTKELSNKFKQYVINEKVTDLTDISNGDDAIRTIFTEKKPSIIQIGGDETAGKGLVQLRLI